MTLAEVKVGMIFKDQEVTVEIIADKEDKFEFMIIKGDDEARPYSLEISKVQMEEIFDNSEYQIDFLGYKKDYPEYYL